MNKIIGMTLNIQFHESQDIDSLQPTRIEEIYDAMDLLKQVGVIKDYNCSNFEEDKRERT